MRGGREHGEFLGVTRLGENTGLNTEKENNFVYILDFVEFYFFKPQVKVCMRD